MEEDNATERTENPGNIKLFLPFQNQLIDVEEDEEVARATQKNFIKDGLLSWVIWTKGD